MRDDRLSKYNPAVIDILLMVIMITGMINPGIEYMTAYCFFGSVYYILLKGKEWFRLFGMFIPMAVLIIIFNLWISGTTGLYHGVQLTAMIYGIICWFACFGSIMNGDKIHHILGGKFPTLALIFSMILCTVPSLRKKAVNVVAARRGAMGMTAKAGIAGRAKEAAECMGILTGIALENAVVTADSMKNRGYGSGERSTFSIFTFGKRDLYIILMTVICVIAGIEFKLKILPWAVLMLIPIVLSALERKG